MQICSILHFSWSILVKCCVHLQTSSSKTQKLLLEKNIFQKYLLFFFIDSWHLHLTFVALCLLSVIRKQQLKQYYYSIDQSAHLTGFWTDFTSLVQNVCQSQMFLLAKCPPWQEARRNGCFYRLDSGFQRQKFARLQSPDNLTSENRNCASVLIFCYRSLQVTSSFGQYYKRSYVSGTRKC